MRNSPHRALTDRTSPLDSVVRTVIDGSGRTDTSGNRQVTGACHDRGVTTRERPGDRGKRRGERLLTEILEEARAARIASGLTQHDVGRALGLSSGRVSLMERGKYPNVPFVLVAQFLGVVGLELAARAYPVGGGLRDIAQVRLLDRLRARTSHDFTWQTEVPIPIPGDLRAWDAVIRTGSIAIGVDAETRLRDFQSVDRRMTLKARDSGVDSMILLLSNSRSNRAILRDIRPIAAVNYPVASGAALAALDAGRRPPGNAIVLL
jgi:transcriptional regulator with XRE-family HTH domain